MKPNLKTRFWRILLRDYSITRVVRVKSLRPAWDTKYRCIAWPTLLVDTATRRSTITPLWTKERYAFWRKPKPPFDVRGM